MSATPGETRPHARGFVPFRILRARPRLMISGALALVTGLVLLYGLGLKPAKALLLGFDLGVVVYLCALTVLFCRMTSLELMQGQARRQDTGRWGVLWTALILTGFVSLALTTEMGAAKGGDARALVIAAVSIVLSWLFLNVMFGMHYAHGFYGDFGKKHEGLVFPGTDQPDYWDFMYFAIVIGMTFQVSDVQISSRYLRRVALLHGVIAFFFNVFIIAISVNIAAGLAG
ncbi:DUF1345 domain-containing protein [Dyella japonica]|uniref:DUF1345 domain-containing protein n=1 Tax=Dyella japonica A8 TaxID=1217721 RepID=A0A075K5Q0_9GAMM|nr:DUF1345 domain-containing protein [Dyella japonica]AIF48997.1 hypothetical protein HY57_17980 [Dyella japonica A8]